MSEPNESKMKVVGKSAAAVNRVVNIPMGGGCGVGVACPKSPGFDNRCVEGGIGWYAANSEKGC